MCCLLDLRACETFEIRLIPWCISEEVCVCVNPCVCQIKDYEKLDSEEERLCRSRQIYDGYIMKELLSCSHVRTRHQHGTHAQHRVTESPKTAKPPSA